MQHMGRQKKMCVVGGSFYETWSHSEHCPENQKIGIGSSTNRLIDTLQLAREMTDKLPHSCYNKGCSTQISSCTW